MGLQLLRFCLIVSLHCLTISSTSPSLELYLGFLSYLDHTDGSSNSLLCCNRTQDGDGCLDHCPMVFDVSLLDSNGFEIGSPEPLATALAVDAGHNDGVHFLDSDDITRPVLFYVPSSTSEVQLLIRLHQRVVGPGRETDQLPQHRTDEIIHPMKVQRSSDFFYGVTAHGQRRSNTTLHLAVRFSCVGNDCLPECLQRPWLQRCTSLPEGKSSKNTYIGNPLARCPNPIPMPSSTTSPSLSPSPSLHHTTVSPNTALSRHTSLRPLTSSMSSLPSPLPSMTSSSTAMTHSLSSSGYLMTSASSSHSLTSIQSQSVDTIQPSTTASESTPNTPQSDSSSVFLSASSTSSSYLTTANSFLTSDSEQHLTSITESSSRINPTASFTATPSMSIKTSAIDISYSLLSSTANSATFSHHDNSISTNLLSTIPTNTGSITETTLSTHVDTSYTQSHTPALIQIISITPTQQPQASTPIPNPTATTSVVVPSPSQEPFAAVSSPSPRPSGVPPRETTTQSPFLPQESSNGGDNAMTYWAIIIGSVLGCLAVVGLIGYLFYRSRQTSLRKHQELYTVTPQMISTIEENGMAGRSDVPMTTALL